MELIASDVAHILRELREQFPTATEEDPMSTQADDQELVTGTITGVVAKGGDKWQALVQPPGSNYTKGLWTKDQNLAAQLQMMVGQQQTFLCGVSNWTNNQGQPVRSLWINGVGQPGVAAAPSPAAVPPPQPVVQGLPTQALPQQVHVQPQAMPMAGMQQQQPRVMQPEYGRRMHPEERAMVHRQSASAVAVELLKFLMPEQQTYDSLLTLTERLVRYYDHGLDGHQQSLPVDPQAQWPAAATAGDPGPEQGYVLPSDDDIPF